MHDFFYIFVLAGDWIACLAILHCASGMQRKTVFNLQVVPELIERNFGSFELQSDDNYHKVWAADARSATEAPPGNAESVEQVCTFPPPPNNTCVPLLYA